MVSIQQRLFAILLRRTLGPILDDDSLRKLHESIDVSLQDGRIVLSNVSLDTAFLQAKNNTKTTIRKAFIGRLCVHISIEDADDATSEPHAGIGIVRALSLGTNASLLAHAHLEDVQLHVQPNTSGETIVKTITTGSTGEDSGSQEGEGMLRSYLDAALSSLRLRVTMEKVSVKLYNAKKDNFVRLQVASVAYRDIASSEETRNDMSSLLLLQKALDLQRISVDCGVIDVPSTRVILLCEKKTTILVRAYQQGDAASANLQHDVQVTTDGSTNLLLDAHALECLRCIVQDVKKVSNQSIVEKEIIQEKEVPTDQDLQVLSHFMEQYQHARARIERNEMKGGILVPDDEDSDNDFDMFFDANDTSVYRYSSVLRESIVASSIQEVAFAQSKLRIQLNEVSIKLVYESVADSPCDNYVLLQLRDVCTQVSASRRGLDVTLDVQQASIDCGVYHPRTRSFDIGQMVIFSSERSQVLVPPSCLSLHVSVDQGKDTALDIDVSLLPLEIIYRDDAIRGVLRLLAADKAALSEDSSATAQEAPSAPSKSLTFHVSCSSATLYILSDTSEDLIPLFARCGRSVVSPRSLRAALGVTLDSLCIDANRNSKQNSFSVTLDYAFFFASAPDQSPGQGQNARRLDFAVLAGRTEVFPSLPVKFAIHRRANATSTLMDLFPAVPPVSTFKAMQEDEDNDVQLLLATRLRDLDIDDPRAARDNNIQNTMKERSMRCDVVYEIQVSECVVDLTPEELSLLRSVVAGLSLVGSAAYISSEQQEEDIAPSLYSSTGWSLSVDSLSLTLHGRFVGLSDDEATSWASYMLKGSRLRSHVVGADSIQQLRFSIHEIDVYEALDRVRADSDELLVTSCEDRRAALHNRLVFVDNDKTTPLIYRSHLFSPISRSSPMMLVDFLPADGRGLGPDNALHVTVYDATYRYNADSLWIQRLSSLLGGSAGSRASSDAPPADSQSSDYVASLTRLYFNTIDVNVDYTSPTRFRTASRSVLRVGELRFSSNLVLSSPEIMACCLSLSDVSFYVCDKRFPYNYENSCLLDSVYMLNDKVLAESAPATAADTREERRDAAFSRFDPRNIVQLSHAELVVAQEQGVTHLTGSVGLLGVYACKDSFACLLNTITELFREKTAIDVQAVKKQQGTMHAPIVRAEERLPSSLSAPSSSRLDELKRQSALRPAAGTTRIGTTMDDYLIDGYDWTTIDYDESYAEHLNGGEEQSARWYSDSAASAISDLQISNNYFGKQQYTASTTQLMQPASGIALTLNLVEMSVKCRFFDGFDWADRLDLSHFAMPKHHLFLLDALDQSQKAQHRKDRKPDSVKKKKELLSQIVGDQPSGTFPDEPLPDEKSMEYRLSVSRLRRRTDRYIQLSSSGIKVELEVMAESYDDLLASSLALRIDDIFIAETISSDSPRKMIGEWISDREHPRETTQSLVALNMRTWRPRHRVTWNSEINFDESVITLTFLPLRCNLHQKAILFGLAFVRHEVEEPPALPRGLQSTPPAMFRSFGVNSFRMKVDYQPLRLNSHALRDGAIVELINLAPLDNLMLTVKAVQLQQVQGFGAAISEMAHLWIHDVCSTQLHKFVKNARPFEPFSNVGGATADMVVLPWEAFQNGDDIQKALKNGARGLAQAFIMETITVSSRFTKWLAGSSGPPRPLQTPSRVRDTTPHAYESISRGLREANRMIVIVPYREYQYGGAGDAAKSIIRGIPVAVTASVRGAAEALSYALVGARNELLPDLRQEEEASQRGLQMDGA